MQIGVRFQAASDLRSGLWADLVVSHVHFDKAAVVAQSVQEGLEASVAVTEFVPLKSDRLESGGLTDDVG